MINIKPTTPEAYKLIHEGMLTLTEATRQGICINVPYCKKQIKRIKSKIKISEKKFFESKIGRLWKKTYKTPNLNSDPQLRNIIYSKLDAKVTKTTSKSENPSTDKETLDSLKKDIPELHYLLEMRRYKKGHDVIDGFLKEQVNGIIHPSYATHTTVSFRSSSYNPNFQNIPNRDPELKELCRKAIIPRKGFCLREDDFSGIEVCISCCVHKDPKMIEYVKFPEKNNMHTDMAIQLYKLDKFQKDGTENKLRKAAKNGFVFPQFYGDYYANNAKTLLSWANIPLEKEITKNDGLILTTGKSLGEHLNHKGIHHYDDFVQHVKEVEYDFWNNRFRVYNNWKKKNVENYNKNGFLQMLSGFTCSGLMNSKEINNYPVQGPGFHCNLKSLIKVNKEIKKRKLKTRLTGEIHDSMLSDMHPKEEKEITEIIRWVTTEWLPEQWKWIIVPLEVEGAVFGVDENWASNNTNTFVLRAS